MTRMTLGAYAATHSVTKQAATAWKRDGVIVWDDGLVDVEKTDERMRTFAKGRFRVTAHGGRRSAGVRGAVDRPGLGMVGEKRATVPPIEPIRADEDDEGDEVDEHEAAVEAYLAAQHPHSIAASLRSAWRERDGEAFADAVSLVAFCEQQEDELAVRLHRWGAQNAGAIAADLGVAERAQEVGDVLTRRLRQFVLGVIGCDDDDIASMERDHAAAGIDIGEAQPPTFGRSSPSP